MTRARRAAPAPAGPCPRRRAGRTGGDARARRDQHPVAARRDDRSRCASARLPAARFSAGQAASTDRRSRRPEDGESWFANDDFVTETQPNLVRVETAARRRQALRAAGRRRARRDRPHLDRDARRDAAHSHRRRRAARARGAGRGAAAGRACAVRRRRSRTSPRAATTSTSRSRIARRCLVTVDDIVSPDPFTGKPMREALLPDRLPDATRGRPRPRVRPYSAASWRAARRASRARRGASRRTAGAAARPGEPTVDDRARPPVEPGQPLGDDHRRAAGRRRDHASCASRPPSARPRSCARRG